MSRAMLLLTAGPGRTRSVQGAKPDESQLSKLQDRVNGRGEGRYAGIPRSGAVRLGRERSSARHSVVRSASSAASPWPQTPLGISVQKGPLRAPCPAL